MLLSSMLVVAEPVLRDARADDLGSRQVGRIQKTRTDHEPPFIQPNVLGPVKVARGFVEDHLVVVTLGERRMKRFLTFNILIIIIMFRSYIAHTVFPRLEAHIETLFLYTALYTPVKDSG